MNKKTPGKAILSLPVWIFCCAGVGAAFAQQASTDQLQEIVVTAQKRESTVQTTPLSITALTGQDLVDRGITDIASLCNRCPVCP
jgi:iron complex outermembrane recepter protein